MLAHHARAIQRLKESFEPDQEVLSIIVGGSVAKGWAREDSDVDYIAVVSDRLFESKLADERLMTYRTDLTDYEGGYTDGKTAPLSFLHKVAERGSEPARSAFLGARVLFDRTGEVGPLIEQILVYPEAGVEERIRRFHSQMMIWRWFVGEAIKREDPYLMARATSELALFAMRLVMAENRRLYPYHKWAMRMVEECADKPEGFLERVSSMLNERTELAAQGVVDAIHAWRPMTVDYGEHCHHFLEDSEWNWMDHLAPIGDR